MSARDSARRTKASQHPDLFIQQSERSERSERNIQDQEEIEDDFSPFLQDQQLHDTYGAGSVSDDPLQLEHVVGFGADSPSNLICLPLNEYSIVKGLGHLITIENINDPHDQKFLRAHDMPVNVLAVSPSGELLASGQYGTTRFKGNAAPVFIWSTLTGRRLVALRGITQRVNLLQFSTDEKFLCGCGDDCLLYVWELASGEVVYVQRFTYPVCIMSWITHTMENRRTVYDLALGVGTTLSKGKFYFDQGRVQWTLSLKPYSLPSGGLVRQFASVTASNDFQYLYVGSTGSDLIVYRHDIAVYRALIPVCSNGVRSIAKLSNGDLLCGGGDGTLTKIRGNDLMWEVIQRIQLNGSILSLSLTSSQSEVLAGCSSGAVYRCMTHSLTSQLITTAHTSAITCVKFGSAHNLSEAKNSDDEDRTGYFATGTSSGELRVWDIADYTCLGYYKETKSFSTSSLSGGDGIGNSVQSISLYGANNSHIISGWKDGSVKCHDITLQRMVWSIPQAHRDGVTAIAVCSKLLNLNNNNNNNNNSNNNQRTARGYSSNGRGNNSNNNDGSGVEYMVTGGKDGAIRIWRLSSRELLTQYTEHTKSISAVLIDLNFPNIIHSTSYDGTVISYDLQASHRKISHIMKGSTHGSSGSSITSMSQRYDSENEVVTCDSQGRIITWDIDIRDPVQVIQDIGYNPSLTCCMISPVSGKYLAFAGDDSVLKILDITRNEIISLGRGHTDGITSLSWTSDERQIITGGKDHCMCVWNFYLGGER